MLDEEMVNFLETHFKYARPKKVKHQQAITGRVIKLTTKFIEAVRYGKKEPWRRGEMAFAWTEVDNKPVQLVFFPEDWKYLKQWVRVGQKWTFRGRMGKRRYNGDCIKMLRVKELIRDVA